GQARVAQVLPVLFHAQTEAEHAAIGQHQADQECRSVHCPAPVAGRAAVRVARLETGWAGIRQAIQPSNRPRAATLASTPGRRPSGMPVALSRSSIGNARASSAAAYSCSRQAFSGALTLA